MAKTAWGIDVGSTGIKFVKLGIGGGGSYELSDCAFFPVEGGEFGPAWAPRLKAFLAQHKMKPTGAVVALGGRDMVIDITGVPRAPQARLQKMIDLHVAQFGDRNEETLSYDWGLLRIPSAAMRDELTTLIAMAKDPYLAQAQAGLEAAGISLAGFTPSPVALFNTFVKFGPLGEDFTYLIDVGEKTLSLAILRENVLLFARNMQSGLDLFIEPLMGALEIKRPRAVRYIVEEGRIGAGDDEETLEYKAGRSLQGSAGQMCQMLASSVKFCQVKTKLRQLEPTKYVLSGGGARLGGLAEFIENMTRQEVVLLDTSEQLSTAGLSESATEAFEDGLTYAVAIGAAQVASGESAFPIQISSSSMKQKQAFYSQTLVMIMGLAATIILLLLTGVTAHSRLGAEQARDAELRGLNEQYKARKKRREELDLRRVALEKKIGEIKRRVGAGSYYFRTLSLIQQVLPEPMWLRDIQLGHEKIGEGPDAVEVNILKIKGTVEESSMTVSTVERIFEAALSADPVIESVTFDNRRDLPKTGQSQFEMTVRYRRADEEATE